MIGGAPTGRTMSTLAFAVQAGKLWRIPALQLVRRMDAFLYIVPTLDCCRFQRLPIAEGEDAAELELMDGSLLVDHGNEYRVTTKDDRIYHFPKNRCSKNTQGQQYWMIGRISDRCGNTLDFEYCAGKVVAINESSGSQAFVDH